MKPSLNDKDMELLRQDVLEIIERLGAIGVYMVVLMPNVESVEAAQVVVMHPDHEPLVTVAILQRELADFALNEAVRSQLEDDASAPNPNDKTWN